MKTKVQRRKKLESLREMSVTQIKRHNTNKLQLVCVETIKHLLFHTFLLTKNAPKTDENWLQLELVS